MLEGAAPRAFQPACWGIARRLQPPHMPVQPPNYLVCAVLCCALTTTDLTPSSAFLPTAVVTCAPPNGPVGPTPGV